jgi:hypothetical protein
MNIIFFPVDIIQTNLERFCQWFQKMTGLTNYWLLGKVCILIAFTIIAEFMYRSLGLTPSWFSSKGLAANLFWRIISGLVMFLYLMEGWLTWKIKEARAFVRLERGLANPLKNSKLIKVIMLFMICFCWVDLYLSGVCTYAFLNSCDPLPPCRGRVKEWWSSRSQKLVSVMENQQ